MPQHQDTGREARLFRDNNCQVLRIPADYEIPGDRVMIRRDGERLIIEPIRTKNLLEVLADLHPLGPEDEFPDIDGSLPPAENVEL